MILLGSNECTVWRRWSAVVGGGWGPGHPPPSTPPPPPPSLLCQYFEREDTLNNGQTLEGLEGQIKIEISFVKSIPQAQLASLKTVLCSP